MIQNKINLLWFRARNESGIVAMLLIIRSILDYVRGFAAAWIVGWRKSYLGQRSRILGSKGIMVGINAHVKSDAWIEAIFLYNDQMLTPQIKIGRNFIAANRLHISAISRIEIGDGCLCGSGVYISDHNHGVYKGTEQSHPHIPPFQRELRSFGGIKIGNNVWLGDNVVVVGSVNIGDSAIIGANSVVTRDIPSNTIAAGSPIKLIKCFNQNNGTWEKLE